MRRESVTWTCALPLSCGRTSGAPDTTALLDVARKTLVPGGVLVLREVGEKEEEDEQDGRQVPQAVRMCGLVEGKAAAYVCRNRVCSLPMTSPSALADRLAGTSRGPADLSSTSMLGSLKDWLGGGAKGEG